MNATSIPSWVKDARTAYAFGVYGYDPSIPAAWTATALYAVMTIVTLAQTLRWSPRAWYMYWIPATAAMELVGYVVRVINLDDRTLGTVIVTMCVSSRIWWGVAMLLPAPAASNACPSLLAFHPFCGQSKSWSAVSFC